MRFAYPSGQSRCAPLFKAAPQRCRMDCLTVGRSNLHVAVDAGFSGQGEYRYRNEMVPRRRFERPTCRLGGGCSIQLSYRGMHISGSHCRRFQVAFECRDQNRSNETEFTTR